MKRMRLAMGVAAFALLGGVVMAGDLDVQALQAKLAAQEARLNDLQAKIGSASVQSGAASGVTSIRKNAKVTIGGQVNTRYFLYSGKIEDAGVTLPNGKINKADFKVSDAKINFKIDVNDYFDAFVRINLQNGGRSSGQWGSGNDGVSTAQYAWIRWKNLCNTGFGVLVGRNDLVYGPGSQSGMIESGWSHNNAFLGDTPFLSYFSPTLDNSFFAPGNTPLGPNIVDDVFNGRINSDHSRTTQITPYWEGLDGRLKIEASFFQDWDYFGIESYNDNGTVKNARNYGTGFSTRVKYAPISGLNLYASFMNRFDPYNDVATRTANATTWSIRHNDKSSTQGLNLGFDYTPACFTRLKVYGQWNHTWKAGFSGGDLTMGNNAVANDITLFNPSTTVDIYTLGFAYGLTEQLKFALTGDYLRAKKDDVRLKGWAIYPALRYTLPYGVNFEVGYQYSQFKVADLKAKLNTLYGHIGFDF